MLLLTSVINNYQVYVSTVQAYNYPFTGFQWHPEVLTWKRIASCSAVLAKLFIILVNRCMEVFQNHSTLLNIYCFNVEINFTSNLYNASMLYGL